MECTEYAKYNDMEIVGRYIDRAYSAKTDNRPDFRRMIKDSYRKQFDIVLVWKLDRCARDLFDSAYYKRILKKNGVRVISAKQTISQGAEGILLESMLEGYAEFYSAELAEKTKRGMKENALKCKSTASLFRSAILRTASITSQSMKRMRPLYGRCSRSISTVRGIKAPARKKALDEYLLTTKLFCGKCGAMMVGGAATA